MFVDIINLGINNLQSISKSFSQTNGISEVRVVDYPAEISDDSLLVLPGLGSFESGVTALAESGFDMKIKEKVSEGNCIVGICLGMQLLGIASEESENSIGLGLIAGNSEKLKADIREKIPHIGWNEVSAKKEFSLFGALSAKKDFYFVHSYHLVPENEYVALSRTPFGGSSFVSSVLEGRVLGFQFHPEKSGAIGQQLIGEIVEWAKNET